ncbi:hypothetical protein VC83_03132 [Pseudogymnoascus destructans]|uniref:Velvet domain-containing protein n=2 Tax=Pseudogymnoascus destructans TaxID=655981 RepID=L8G3S3_PSED2|nr:uncharacterized protein VC83_03132 [Pseudogymnoascus destructans]ELR06581.1 hypothetical protein GMDG_08054 [Pseudogymnoascus destructans 20631-21]OAF59963.1 hypothetical protein VC83_03132 [Pseudogymnoascus destructans]
MKVSHYPHDDPTGHGAQYNMSPPLGNPNYRPDAPQYQAHQDQPHIQHAPNDQQQYGYGSNPQGHRASQSSEGQGGQGEMLGRVPTRGPNPLMPLDSPSNHNGADGTPILPAVQQQAGDHPPSFSMIELGRRYTLEVMQQPKRARMCGFGDKDRRPITPPPCIRVVITDVATGNEIDTNDIDHGSFVLTVDLWSADGKHEVNLVRHSSASPAISSTIPTSYAQAQAGDHPVYSNPMPTPTGPPGIVRDPQYPYHSNQPLLQGQYNPYPGQPQVNAYGQTQQQFQQGPPQGQYGQPQQQGQYGHGQERQNYHAGSGPEPPNHHIFYHTGDAVHPVASNAPRPSDNLMYDPTAPPRQAVASAPQGMFTRNLIGSLAASASKLADPHDKIGIWFVLQDMSIRTEGNFRLRFSFTNVGGPSKTPNGNPANQMSVLNTGKAPVLALCYSDVFTVYSAKKFPGVVESTPLSKCFATQGVKIPIRKDGGGKAGQGREDYDED